ncbi:MAG: hypothetical protein ABR562_00875 [Thermoplasmatota archaeon]|nr:hypothetical protein [Halobacteriales archaeon]
MAKFLVVHGIPAIRAALRKELAAHEPGAAVAEAEWGPDGLRIDAEWSPDAVFIGLVFGHDTRDVATMAKLLQTKPARPVVLCTMLPRDDPNVVQALSLGAFAYIPQPMPKGLLKQTLAQLEVLRGGRRRVP